MPTHYPMEDWKKKEVEMLRADIYDRLIEIGVEPKEARAIVQGHAFYCGPLGNDEDRSYLNMRTQRINSLIASYS